MLGSPSKPMLGFPRDPSMGFGNTHSGVKQIPYIRALTKLLYGEQRRPNGAEDEGAYHFPTPSYLELGFGF